MAMELAPGKTRIGWIGTGVMGASMCGHLMTAGYSVTVYNRSRNKAKPLIDRGAAEADSPRAVAEASDVIFTIVGYPRDVREVTLGPDGTLAGAKSGSILVDMTTSEPALAVEIAEQAHAKGVHSVDAPVSGGDVGAKEARLSIMIGGEDEPVESLRPLFEKMGKTIVHQGPPGAGQHTKMVNQILIATNMIGVCEALLYGYKAGLDLNTVLQSVGSGAAGSWSLNNLGPRMIAGRFEPGFFVEHFLKDMGIALAEARRMQLSLPGLALAEQLYQAVRAQGHGRDGTHALMLALARLSAIDWKGAPLPVVRGVPYRLFTPEIGWTMFHAELGSLSNHTPTRVLLVDDNAEARNALRRYLEFQGFLVTAQPNGAGALRSLANEPPPEIVLTDLILPDLDGREIARQAHQLSPPPVIALITGWGVDLDDPNLARWGIDLLFFKPLDVQDLVRQLQQALFSRSRAGEASK